MPMAKINLSIPFTIPLLGEAFVSSGNPLLTATLDFSINAKLIHEEQGKLEIPINSKPLRAKVARYLESHGVGGRFRIESQITNPIEQDFIGAASLLFTTGADELEADIPTLISKTNDSCFITLARSLTALSGGFVVSRKGEGLISLDGRIGAPVHIRTIRKRIFARRKLESFSCAFPDLAGPLWHLLGHLVLDGSEAIRAGDASRLGRLFSLEGALAHSAGLVGLGDLRRIASVKPAFGGKAIYSDAFAGELILAPEETLPAPSYSRFRFNQGGVKEIGSS